MNIAAAQNAGQVQTNEITFTINFASLRLLFLLQRRWEHRVVISSNQLTFVSSYQNQKEQLAFYCRTQLLFPL